MLITVLANRTEKFWPPSARNIFQISSVIVPRVQEKVENPRFSRSFRGRPEFFGSLCPRASKPDGDKIKSWAFFLSKCGEKMGRTGVILSPFRRDGDGRAIEHKC